jgi:hypothetical protein
VPSFTISQSDLRQRGPVVLVNVAVTSAAEAALAKAGETVPPPVPVTAVLDTGSFASAIGPGIAQRLGLKPVGVMPVSTPSSSNVPMPLYALRLILPQNVVFETTAIEARLQGQGIGALIGRDVLSKGVMVYIGYANQFTFSF